MKYAIVASGGKQYKVREGDIITVDKLPLQKDASHTFDKVLLLATEISAEIGTPYLLDVTVLGKLIEQTKGEKLYISKFKAKARHRRRSGFRSLLSRVQIVTVGKKDSIEKKETASNAAEAKAVAKKVRVKKVA